MALQTPLRGVEGVGDLSEIKFKPKYDHIDLRESYFDWPVHVGGYYWEDQVQRGGGRVELEEATRRHTERTFRLIDSIATEYGGPKENIGKLRESFELILENSKGIDEMVDKLKPGLESLLSCYPSPRQAPFLLERPGPGLLRLTNPLEQSTDLFLEFASLKPTRQAAQDFANKNGLLRDSPVQLISTDKSLSNNDIKKHFRVLEFMSNSFYVYGETLDFWQAAIRRMKWTVAVWESLKDEDEQALRRIIHWTNNGDKIRYILADEEILDQYSTASEVMAAAEKVAFPNVVDDLIDNKDTIQKLKLKKGDILLPAKLVIQRRINLELSVPELARTLQNTVKLRLWLEENNSLVSSFEPKDLLTAMWLQFYFTASGHYTFRRCDYCHDWVDVSNKNKNWHMHKECANKKRVEEFRAKSPAEEAKPKTAKKPAGKKAARGGKK